MGWLRWSRATPEAAVAMVEVGELIESSVVLVVEIARLPVHKIQFLSLRSAAAVAAAAVPRWGAAAGAPPPRLGVGRPRGHREGGWDRGDLG